jgi:hypothetical protein
VIVANTEDVNWEVLKKPRSFSLVEHKTINKEKNTLVMNLCQLPYFLKSIACVTKKGRNGKFLFPEIRIARKRR